MSLECRHITVEHTTGKGKDLRVLDHLNARFENGRINLITGPAGSGKTTLLHVLGNLLRPTAGELLADDQPVSRWRPKQRDAWRRMMGILFQHLHLLPHLSVHDNILLPLIPRRQSWLQMSRSLHFFLETLNLAALADAPLKQLSGGQRQRTAIARAMIGAPRYLLLDEPTTFQDDPATSHLLTLWRQTAQDGACVVICSHDVRLRQAAEIDRRYTLHQGKLERRA